MVLHLPARLVRRRKRNVQQRSFRDVERVRGGATVVYTQRFDCSTSDVPGGPGGHGLSLHTAVGRGKNARKNCAGIELTHETRRAWCEGRLYTLVRVYQHLFENCIGWDLPDRKPTNVTPRECQL